MSAVAPLAVAFAQAASFAATFGMFPPAAVPGSVRAALAILLIPLLVAHRTTDAHTPSTFVSAIVAAILVGAGYGLSASIMAAAARAAGSLIDNAFAGGLFAQGIFEGVGPLSRLYSIAFVLVFLTTGAYTRLIAAFVSESVALHDFHLGWAALTLAHSCMLAGLALAGPALFAQVFAALLSGAVARVAPHINGLLLNAPLSSALALGCVAMSGAMLWPALAALSQKVVTLSAAFAR